MTTITYMTDLVRLATSEDLAPAPWPPEARELLARAAQLRAGGEHVVAGDLERDAAALIRIAHDRATEARVAARLLRGDVRHLSPAQRAWLAERAARPCPTCLDGTVVSDTCDDCGARHCPVCEDC